MPNAAARILDANANRAREALRMMEDSARFALNDAALSTELKAMRHELRSILDTLPPGWLEANRDTPGDVGTAITTPSEQQRANLRDIAIAAGKRLSESLRVMEETAKTINPATAARFEALRYRAYTVEATLNARLHTTAARQWRVCVLLTESLCAQSWERVLQAAIDNGAGCIQLREKAMSDQQLLARAECAVAIAHASGASVIINDRPDIALLAGADGVHLGTGDLPIARIRELAGRSLLTGASTHDLAEADAAVQAGADYCGVGAMFTSSLKPQRTPSGIAYLRTFIERYPHVPHLAIGGITPGNIDQLIAAGANGVAVSTAVCGSDDPGKVVRELCAAYASEKSYEAV